MENSHGIKFLGLSYNGSLPVKKTENFWVQPARISIQLNKPLLISNSLAHRSSKKPSPFACRWKPEKSASKMFLRYKFSKLTEFNSNESLFSSICNHKKSKKRENAKQNINFSKKLSISPKICFGLTKMKKIANPNLTLGHRRENNEETNSTKISLSRSALKRSLSLKNCISSSFNDTKTFETTASESYTPWFIKYPYISPIHKS
ncbi:unnamed protein product [Blepharisma stoltei]|uniref:Uncharacterized protein n=1 Tax=Blepharisma stoltei TaxID=1481888 RepID=A0AAU9JLQ6_9CILI|nr:unnamed protein product [Blepharisma stoltei]